MTIVTNYTPYHDDFNEDKNFYRTLYRPAFPVQTRELNQQQTLLQNQIGQYGKHIFVEGSLVLGGAFELDTNFPYVLLTRKDENGNTINPLESEGKTYVGRISGVKAYVFKTDRVVYQGNIYYPAFIRYLSGSTTNETSTTFSDSEILENVNDSMDTIVVAKEYFGAAPVIGRGSIFTINEGVVFSYNLFVNFPRQTIVLDPFSKRRKSWRR